MGSKIEILWKQALKTFSGCKSNHFKLCQKNFDELRSLINNITAEDVKVDRKVLDYVRVQPAPMCTIDVFQNQDITIAIFILKSGVTLPMHDHPNMHGLLKVINGIVKIDSYSIDMDNDKIAAGKSLPAIRHPSITVSPADPACVLTPIVKNLHEITCLEGPAAFLDILSPPYDSDVYNNSCRFYKTVPSSERGDKVHLIVSDPPSFYSGSVRYMGQPLT